MKDDIERNLELLKAGKPLDISLRRLPKEFKKIALWRGGVESSRCLYCNKVFYAVSRKKRFCNILCYRRYHGKKRKGRDIKKFRKILPKV